MKSQISQKRMDIFITSQYHGDSDDLLHFICLIIRSFMLITNNIIYIFKR